MKDQDMQLEILRSKSPAERLKLAFGLFDFTRQRIAAEITRLNPRLSSSELNRLIGKRFSR